VTLVRKAIRRAVIRSLKGKTAAGDAVYGMRTEAIRTDLEGPFSLSVYTLSEAVEIDTDTPRIYERALELAVEVFVESEAGLTENDLGNAIDDLTCQVEAAVEPCLVAIVRAGALGLDVDANLSKVALSRVEIEETKDGRQLAGNARVVWTLPYFTEVDEAAIARVRPFHGLHVEYDVPPPAAPPEAVDDLDVPPPQP
jgi:hypothetical protein